jgi:hypothetical protein
LVESVDAKIVHQFTFSVWREAHDRKHTGRTAYHTQREKHEHHRNIPHTQPEQTRLKRQTLHYQQHDFRKNTYTKLKCKPPSLRPFEQALRSNTRQADTLPPCTYCTQINRTLLRHGKNLTMTHVGRNILF